MAWTTPKTWSSEPLTSTDLNTYIRDNQTYLKERVDAEAKQYIRTSGDYTTTSGGAMVDMDTTNMNLTITTTGGDVQITFAGYGSNSNTAIIVIGFRVDDTTDYEIVTEEISNSNEEANLSSTYILTGLSAGSHSFKMRWRCNGGTMYAGSMLFDVREIQGVVS